MYLKYLHKLLTHKWYVFLECVKLGMPIVGLIHDWSKFLPDEYIPYARTFCGKESADYKTVGGEFDAAWLKHQRRNPHHWQYWVLIQDEDEDKVLPMPERYRKEMLADWHGAGRSYGEPDTRKWYLANREKMQLHRETQRWIEQQLGVA
jgi:hypothetical protein